MHQQNNVIGVHFTGILLPHGMVDIHYLGDPRILHQPLHHLQEDFGQYTGVIIRAVVVLLRHTQALRYGIQLVLFQLRVHGARHYQRIDLYRVLFPAAPPDGRPQKSHIKIGVVGNQNITPVTEAEKLLQGLRFLGGARYHLIGNTGKPGDFGCDRLFRVHKQVKGLHNLPVFHLYGADLNDPFRCGRKPGGFQIENNIPPVDRGIGPALYGRQHIIDEIPLHTVDCLKVGVILPDLLHRIHDLREGLHHTVVGHRHSGMPPAMGTLHQVLCGAYAVHRGHGGMQVQLHPLDRRIIGKDILFDGIDMPGAHHHITVVFIVADIPLYQNGHPRFQVSQPRL